MPRKDETFAWFSKIVIILWALVLVGTFLPPKVAAGPDVDLELVLAVDTSDSMSRAELSLQRHGYIAALRSAEVGAAIAFRGGVALMYVEWAGPDEQRIVVPWTVLSDGADAERFAEMLAKSPLDPGYNSPPWKTGTSVSHALLFAAKMFSAGTGASRTIDISGDGPSNSGGPLSSARELVIAEGITINGLPIINAGARPDLTLAAYYEECVIGGPGAFAIAVNDPSLFETAIRRKLVLEIAALHPMTLRLRS